MNIAKRWLASVMLICAFVMAAGPVGCSRTTLSEGGVYQGDQTLYEAEKAIVTAHKSFNAFLTWEMLNRAILSVDVSRVADTIRLNEERWLASAHALRDAYVATPTAENKDKLQLTLNLINTALAEATRHMAANKRMAPNTGLNERN